MKKNDYIKLLKSGYFPNEKNRIWTMCKVVLEMATHVVDEAERCNMTNEQFFIEFEDAMNLLSIKDHSGSNEQTEDFKKAINSFIADSE